jgi:hypothetical protein
MNTQSRSIIVANALSVCLVAAAPPGHAQGCFPIRYTSPMLGEQTSSPQGADQWQVGVNYRLLHADRFFVGREYRPDAAPGGQPSRININSIEVTLSYAPTSRFTVTAGVPFATGTHSRLQDDGLRHTLSATGFGDVNLVATAWLLNPPVHPTGNVAVGLGVKAPTGENSKSGDWHTVTGAVQRPLDPSIQLGDGGWGAIVRAEAFRQFRRQMAAYFAGAYLANPKASIDATFTTPYGVVAPVAVTDEYSAHAGLTVDASARRGLSLSLGARIDGVPVRDVVGGGDESFRRPGYAVYVEPAVALRRSRSPVSPAASNFTLGIPVRVDQNRLASALDIAHGKHGGGDFAQFLVFLGYSKRW